MHDAVARRGLEGTARAATGLALVLAMVACSGADPAPSVGGASAPSVAGTAETIPRAVVERDLALEMTRTSTAALDHERTADVEVWLVNRSATRSYPVVLANDGSEVGWREPRAFFRLEGQRPSGAWEPLSTADLLRCGNYAEDWTKDVVTLAPGARVKMPWMPYPPVELGDATRVRITARYEYGEHARDKSKVPPVLHPMPSYAIASAPLELPVEHPYALTLKMKGPLPTRPGAPLGPALDVVVENRSSRSLPVGTSESGAQLWFEVRVDGEPEQAHALFVDTTPTFPSKETLAAGGRASIVTAQTRTDVVWSLPAGKLVQMRALWRIWEPAPDRDGPDRQRRVTSAWVDVP